MASPTSVSISSSSRETNTIFTNENAIIEHDIVNSSDARMTFIESIFNHHREGETLSTPSKMPKRAWQQQRSLIYDEDPKELSQEISAGLRQERLVIPGRDGRERIIDTNRWPYRFHAHLDIKFRDDSSLYGGSGALVGPHHILTCAHNVYDDKHKWAEKISVYPALNEKDAPFKSEVVKVYTFKSWTDRRDRKFDIALLILNQSVGKETGWAGLLSTDDSALSQEEVQITGYPGDKGFKQMWNMSHKISRVYPEEFSYEIDTYGGQSGSAIWINKYGIPLILGVHTLGGDGINHGVRISHQKFAHFLKIISKTYRIAPSTSSPQLANEMPPVRDVSTVAPLNPVQVVIPSSPVAHSSANSPQLTHEIPTVRDTPAAIPLNLIQVVSPLPVIPEIAFGKAAWEKYFGDIGEAPPLPPYTQKILEGSCPIWPGKKVKETHLLVLIPRTVNDKYLTFVSLDELVRHPKEGHPACLSGAISCTRNVKNDYFLGFRNQPLAYPSSPYWVLLSKDVLPNSRTKGFSQQCQMVQQLAREAQAFYEVPLALEVATCLLTEYVRSGVYSYPDISLGTYTRCRDVIEGRYVTVGTNRGSIGIGLSSSYDSFYSYGIGVSRRL